MFLLTFDGRLGTAPPNSKDAKVGRVLDLGTGTGIWAIEFGDEHPEAEVRYYMNRLYIGNLKLLNKTTSSYRF